MSHTVRRTLDRAALATLVLAVMLAALLMVAATRTGVVVTR